MNNKFLKFWVPVYAYALLIFILSSIPGKALPLQIPLSDKLLHLIEYGILGYLTARAFKSSGRKWVLANFHIWAIIAVTLYGFTDEFHQYFVPNRMAGMGDILFDGLGAFVGQLFLRVPFFKDV